MYKVKNLQLHICIKYNRRNIIAGAITELIKGEILFMEPFFSTIKLQNLKVLLTYTPNFPVICTVVSICMLEIVGLTSYIRVDPGV